MTADDTLRRLKALTKDYQAACAAMRAASDKSAPAGRAVQASSAAIAAEARHRRAISAPSFEDRQVLALSAALAFTQQALTDQSRYAAAVAAVAQSALLLVDMPTVSPDTPTDRATP